MDQGYLVRSGAVQENLSETLSYVYEWGSKRADNRHNAQGCTPKPVLLLGMAIILVQYF